jgi:hypothetical protein
MMDMSTRPVKIYQEWIHRDDIKYLPSDWIPCDIKGDYALFKGSEPLAVTKIIRRNKALSRSANGR